MKERRTCPHCRKEGFQSIRNWEKIREINELRVRCTNREKGCEWVGALETLKDHHKSVNGCAYAEAECGNKGYESAYFERECGQKME